MSKYNFGLDLKNNNTMKIINELILPNSQVLEFGCACGRLTKYLKEEKKCNVTIVEIDEEAGKIASNYAVKSFIGSEMGDIEKYIWAEQMQCKFDYIIFADVLEHLYYPQKVLERCKSFLTLEGSILTSLPNVAHNSVIIDLIKGKFNYESTGLLDDTHIRFFTHESFNKLLEKIQLKAVKEFATYSKVGENEIENRYEEVSPYIGKELIKRPNANVYQYVYEIKKMDLINPIDTKNYILEHKFCDYGVSVFITNEKKQGFENVEPIVKKYIPQEGMENKIIFTLGEDKYINKLRIDPIECNCVIKINSIKLYLHNGELEIPVKISNSDYQIGNVFFFGTNDPQLHFEEINQSVNKIEMSFELIEYEVLNEGKYNILRQELGNKDIIIEQKESYINEQRQELNKQRQELENRHNIIKEKEDKLNVLKLELDRIKSSKYYKAYIATKQLLGRKD